MLDEPFGALDAFTREELWDVLQDLWLRQRFTTILVTHDLREAVYLADTVYVMSSAAGPHHRQHAASICRGRAAAHRLRAATSSTWCSAPRADPRRARARSMTGARA